MKTAIIGGGVIGGGWAARFLLNGHDVRIFDPHPDARRLLGEVLANAERALTRLTSVPLPEKGRLVFTDTIAEAVKEADYIQESVPERLDLKAKVYGEIEQHAKPDALIGSSTSGFKPSVLFEGLIRPERFFVAHPFNPVYLLPVVEIVAAPAASPAALERAQSFLSGLGMKPILVRAEIDGHIADRLLEAVWREGLWLVHDGIATTAEIDDVIRYGFGLRWAQMGLFETYRIAGGEAGMRHFIGQFGPALKWPWTKLMDVPDLTDALIDKIVVQSDAQSGMHSIRELERIRDDNLVAILQALKGRDWGAGNTLRSYEGQLLTRANAGNRAPQAEATGPLALHRDRVREDFVDYNGHMTEHRYLQVFADATDTLLRHIGMDGDYLASGRSVYTVETHIRHLDEAKLGDPLRVETHVLGFDVKRIRLIHQMFGGADDRLLATAEHMLLHVDTAKASASPIGQELLPRLEALRRQHATLARPDYAGQAIRDIGTTAAAMAKAV